ncbi:TonB C-terminal domain-containing protein [Stenotrophomonas sp. PS02289]|uniref:TonB C-terminal domain-containing protein n=1 Tax=Stenotrophomonas sp. PS02289 TaxID=2991422 RepID=UPI00249C6FEA|nr:TonB C-terminal domain-containing protein [Stenotrophomonas sp. PS02289]
MRTMARCLMMSVVLMGAPAWAEVSKAPPARTVNYNSPEWKAQQAELEAEYGTAIGNRVLAYWRMPASVSAAERCTVEIMQVPGGMVISARVTDDCPWDEAGKRSLEAAVLDAQPLPYHGFEQVFRRTLRVGFVAPAH